MKLLVVDGLSETRQDYLNQLSEIEEISSVYHCSNAEDAVFNVFDVDPDLVVSSEILSFRSGFSIAKIIANSSKFIPLIIVSKDASNAISAIKYNVFDYLVCHNSYLPLKSSVKRAINFIVSSRLSLYSKVFMPNIKLRTGYNTCFKLLDLDTLAYCLADGSYTRLFYCNGKVELVSILLGRIERILTKYHFVRISRSAIVNMKTLTKIDRYQYNCTVELESKCAELFIGKTYLKQMIDDKLL